MKIVDLHTCKKSYEQMNKEKMMKTFSMLVLKLRDKNPYPTDIFIEPTKEEYKKIKKMFTQHSKKSLDGFSGSISRSVWNLCCDEFEKMLKEEKNE